MDLRINTEYDPMGMIYTITAGKHSVILPERAVTKAGIQDLTEALVSISDDNTIKTILNDWAIAAESKANGSLTDGKIKTVLDSIGASISQVNAAIADWSNSITDDPGKDATVACCDYPKAKPYYDPNDIPKVYYNDRFPSVPARTIIDEAIKLLNAKKNLHMTKVDINQVFEGFKLRLHSDMPAVRGMGKTLVALIKHAAFDRAQRTDIDMHAGLKAKLDTDTYIKLRIAFLLFEALKADDYNKPNIDSDICEVVCFDSKVRFTR